MASKRRLRRKTCEGKKAFDTPEQAMPTKKYVQKRDRTSLQPHKVEIYECPFCGKYHVGKGMRSDYFLHRARKKP